MRVLYNIPSQEKIDCNKRIDIIVAPPGLHDTVLFAFFKIRKQCEIL